MNHVENITKHFLADPFQKHCGVELVEQGDGKCLCKVLVGQEQANASGRLHAGVTYSVSDVTAFLAAITLLDEGQYPVTHNISASILSSVEMGSEVFFEASVLRKGRTQIFIEVKSYICRGKHKKLLSNAMITKSIINDVSVY